MLGIFVVVFFIKNRLTSSSVLRFSTTIMNLLIRKNNFLCDFFLLEEDKKKFNYDLQMQDNYTYLSK